MNWYMIQYSIIFANLKQFMYLAKIVATNASNGTSGRYVHLGILQAYISFKTNL